MPVSIDKSIVFRKISQMLRRERYSWDELNHFRKDNFIKLLSFVKENSPWHKERIKHINIDGDLSIDFLREIPPMSKTDLLSNFDSIVSDRQLTYKSCIDHLEINELEGNFLFNKYRVSNSGGSSGTPALYVLEKDEILHHIANSLRFIFYWNSKNNAWPLTEEPRIVGITSTNAVFKSQQIVHYLGSPAILSINEGINKLIIDLNKVSPQVIFTYPSLIPELVTKAKEGNLNISPCLFVLGAEPLHHFHENLIKDMWPSCSIINGWGSIETGVLGAGIGTFQGMILLDDDSIIEPVDRNGSPVNIGERVEKVYVTPLFRRTVPLIRYEVDDQFYLDDRITQQFKSYRKITNVDCRFSDTFYFSGKKEIRPSEFQSILYSLNNIHKFQIRQNPCGIDISLTGAAPLDKDIIAQQINKLFESKQIFDQKIHIEQVESIVKTKTANKHLSFLPLR